MSRAETSLAIAKRHVKEAEERIMRLAAVVEQWERGGRRPASELAKSALNAARPILEVARDRLRIERAKSGIARQPRSVRRYPA